MVYPVVFNPSNTITSVEHDVELYIDQQDFLVLGMNIFKDDYPNIVSIVVDENQAQFISYDVKINENVNYKQYLIVSYYVQIKPLFIGLAYDLTANISTDKIHIEFDVEDVVSIWQVGNHDIFQHVLIDIYSVLLEKSNILGFFVRDPNHLIETIKRMVVRH